MVKVYLDNCSLQRPLDSKTQTRVRLEAEAVLVIIALCDERRIELISSDALIFECFQNSDIARQDYALETLKKAATFIKSDAQIKNRARELMQHRIELLDALHIASAERAQSDYFCTTDDGLLKKAQGGLETDVRIVSPTEFLEELDNDN